MKVSDKQLLKKLIKDNRELGYTNKKINREYQELKIKYYNVLSDYNKTKNKINELEFKNNRLNRELTSRNLEFSNRNAVKNYLEDQIKKHTSNIARLTGENKYLKSQLYKINKVF